MVIYNYDNSDRVIEKITKTWSMNDWENYWRELITYFKDDLIETITYQEWDGSWINKRMEKYQWNSINLQTEYLIQLWFDNSYWYNSEKYSYSYDQNNNLINNLHTIGNDTGWVNDYQYIFTYENNLLSQWLYQYWGENYGYGSRWLNGTRMIYDYDDDGRPIDETQQKWNSESSQWINRSRWLKFYNNLNFLVSIHIQEWSDSYEWQESTLDSMVYDSHGNKIEVLSANWDGTSWLFNSRALYNWIPVTGIEHKQPPIISFILLNNYPNPFNPTTTISYSIGANVETGHAMSVQLIVYNLLGQKVATLVNEKQIPGRYSVTLDASQLTSGVYFYKLIVKSENNKEIFTAVKKMILTK